MDNHTKQQQKFVNLQNKIAKKCTNGKCIILKGGYFYRDDYKGYTELYEFAGVYELADALTHVTACSFTDYITIIPVPTLEHNKKLIDKIKILTNHLIS